jgi:DNA-binding transcriptional ArsR family regulator
VRDLEDTLGIRQPGLSQQLAELREAGFVVGRKVSKSMFYRLADSRVSEFIAMMHRMFCEVPQSDRKAMEK